MDNMAAIDQINLLCRQVSVRVTALEGHVHARLARIEQALGITPGAAPAPDRPAVAPATPRVPSRRVLPGAARIVQPTVAPEPTRLEPQAAPPAPAAVPPTPAPVPGELAKQLLDWVRVLSPETADSIQQALDSIGARPASQPPAADPNAWLASEQPAAPPVADVVTTHVDHV